MSKWEQLCFLRFAYDTFGICVVMPDTVLQDHIQIPWPHFGSLTINTAVFSAEDLAVLLRTVACMAWSVDLVQ